MSLAELRKILELNGLNAVDVAAATKLSPQTVHKFLKGGSIHRSNAFLIETYARQVQESKRASGAKTANG